MQGNLNDEFGLKQVTVIRSIPLVSGSVSLLPNFPGQRLLIVKVG
jgi:hypothetical protein